MNKYFNPDGLPSYEQPLYGGSNDVFLNMNEPRYNWAKNIIELMEANTWTVGEVNTANEKANFSKLTENEQMLYKMTFAQLSYNDSAIEDYLIDFTKFVNNKMVRAAIKVQTMQEILHSRSYSVLLDNTGVSEEVYGLYKHDDLLYNKNQSIAEEFARYIEGTTSNDMLLSAMGVISMEGIYFLNGFGFIYTLGDKVPGARDMIKFINRDEDTHMALFANIYKTLRKENNIDTKIIDKTIYLLERAVEIELTYAKELARKYPVLGISENIVEESTKNFCNQRLSAIGLEPIYDTKIETNLEKLIKSHGDRNSKKENFFEANVTNYTKGVLVIDEF